METFTAANSTILDPGGNVHDHSVRSSASSIIAAYLVDNVPEFRELAELRTKGWSNPKGDAFFRKQRRNADESDEKTAVYFYNLMKIIGQELQDNTNAFALRTRSTKPPSILDMCMAPGGFLAKALSFNPNARALAFSLPASAGGHRVLLPRSLNIEKRFLDITMLAEDMGVRTLPTEHPGVGGFLPRHLEPWQRFDLIICDGQVLRTHSRAFYREKREAVRLTATQLALGLEHVRLGGTMIVLFHKVEAWDTVTTLRRFHRFASVKLFKPKRGHATRSSFYMVATDIQSQGPEAIAAVERWKTIWRAATFGSDEEYECMLCEDELDAEELLRKFGSELVGLGREVWKVQADALAKASFIRGSRVSG
ncbi:hypothetical protein B0T10DRAFT_501928 [Thelonectria olida]|uniref:Ribosomal RNA methyltransferase FtsJ domain-containing protein n=1 Tax=Thelonectria olida TaxID=1576542 RepID=A0A9P9AJF7_9HYPO|nr:hypothetical protein B0T10DRAFT_501928 [Thelonectria olida]